MAKAIKQIKQTAPDPQEQQMQAVSDMVAVLAENKDAILKTVGILKELHEMGALDAVHALLEKRVDVGAIAVGQMNQTGMHNMMKNGMNAVKFLGSVQPERLEIMLNGVGRGLQRLTDAVERGDKPSLWQIGKSMRHPEIRTSLTTMTEFLHGMGEAFSHDSRHVH
ncbi:DUF1641 domain-containing protein [Ectobacillus ponti]|uniref:DUF1641 domain-containing protein n=1 Tax=Ectobacillus ponti TaxID=2961894 RepID=A0AA41X6F8_9BACI|nr:DUF1641 domain-containing protein [Ectobacillus ponti]MCP8969577.1 DUF1641 domain-containing protein [Ectobacillus ponti]